MPETATLENRNAARPKTKPRGFTLNAVFLLVTVCAVTVGMIHSGVRRVEQKWRKAVVSATVVSSTVVSATSDEDAPRNRRRITFSERIRYSSLKSEAAFVVTSVLCSLVGLIVGVVVGAHRDPKGRNIALGGAAGVLSGLTAAAFFAFPPTPAALLVGCVMVVGTAGLMRRV